MQWVATKNLKTHKKRRQKGEFEQKVTKETKFCRAFAFVYFVNLSEAGVRFFTEGRKDREGVTEW